MEEEEHVCGGRSSSSRRRRYFVIKTTSVESLLHSIKHGVWAVPWRKTSPQPLHLLRDAFGSGAEVVLLFSVNGARSWKGYARMTAHRCSDVRTEQDKQADDLQSPFTGLANDVAARDRLAPPIAVQWLQIFPDMANQGLPFAQTAALLNRLDSSRSVNLARNCQELCEATGAELCILLERAVSLELRRQSDAILEKERERASMAHLFVTTDDVSHAARWQGFIQEVSKLGELLYAGHIGSRSYNLHTAQSDVDMLAVVAYPTERILSAITPPNATVKNAEGFQPDFTLHEVAYFCQLLLHGDARMVETLFQDQHHAVVHQGEEFEWLRKNRTLFLTQKVLNSYLSEITGSKGIPNLIKMHNGLRPDDERGLERLNKKWYVVHRLLGQAKQLANGEQLQLWLSDESYDRQFLLEVRKGAFTHAQLLTQAQLALDSIKAQVASGACPLPLSPSDDTTDLLSGWLEAIRFRSLPPSPSKEPVAYYSGRVPPEHLTMSLPPNSAFVFLHQRQDGSYIGVFVSSPKRLLLGALAESERKQPTAVNGAQCILYEAGKFAQLLLAGNPACVEALFLAGDYETPQWSELRQARETILTSEGLLKMTAYLRAQLKQHTSQKGKWQQNHDRALDGSFWRYLALLHSLVLPGASPIESSVGDIEKLQQSLEKIAAKVRRAPRFSCTPTTILESWLSAVRLAALQQVI